MLPHRGRQIGKRGAQYPTGLWSWGNFGNGRIGTNDAIQRSSPTQVGALTNWVQISTGWYHTTAIKNDGTLWAWGDATYGKLGHNASVLTDISSPTKIGTDTSWRTTSVGWYHSHAIKTDGTLWAWGYNVAGRLGHNTANTINRSSPVQIGALGTWAIVSAGGGHSLAIKNDGTLWGWGRNGNGNLGLNASPYRSSPTQVGVDTNWSQVVAGGFHSLGLKNDGTLWGWGGNNTGQLGLNRTGDTSSPAQVGSDTNWAFIADGKWSFSVALRTNGTLWTWGDSTFGELGTGNNVDRSSPTQVGAATDWIRAATGKYHVVAQKADGTIWTWGNGANGRLGNNDIISRSSPIQIGAVKLWAPLTGGESQSIVLRLP